MSTVPNPTDSPTAVDVHDRLVETTERLVRTADALAAALRKAPEQDRFDWQIFSYACAVAVLMIAFAIVGALAGVR